MTVTQNFFVLSKLVDASRTPRELVIRLEVVTRVTISPLSLVKSGCPSPPLTPYGFEKVSGKVEANTKGTPGDTCLSGNAQMS